MTTVADALRPYAAHTKRWVVLLLHSALSVEEQVGDTWHDLVSVWFLRRVLMFSSKDSNQFFVLRVEGRLGPC